MCSARSASCWHQHSRWFTYQSHSLPTVSILSPLRHNSALNSSQNWASHISGSFPNTTSLYNENTQPIRNPAPPNGSNEVLCTRCGMYVNHGKNQTTNYPLRQHQDGQKCKVGFTSVCLSLYILFISYRCNFLADQGSWINPIQPIQLPTSNLRPPSYLHTTDSVFFWDLYSKSTKAYVRSHLNVMGKVVPFRCRSAEITGQVLSLTSAIS